MVKASACPLRPMAVRPASLASASPAPKALALLAVLALLAGCAEPPWPDGSVAIGRRAEVGGWDVWVSRIVHQSGVTEARYYPELLVEVLAQRGDATSDLMFGVRMPPGAEPSETTAARARIAVSDVPRGEVALGWGFWMPAAARDPVAVVLAAGDHEVEVRTEAANPPERAPTGPSDLGLALPASFHVGNLTVHEDNVTWAGNTTGSPGTPTVHLRLHADAPWLGWLNVRTRNARAEWRHDALGPFNLSAGETREVAAGLPQAATLAGWPPLTAYVSLRDGARWDAPDVPDDGVHVALPAPSG